MIKKTVSFILLLCVISGGFGASYASDEGIELFVSLTGSDTNDGSILSPLRTLDGARKKVRNLKGSGASITVNFREGNYFVNKTTSFTAEDSAPEGKKITYRGYQNEKVVFSGSRPLDVKKFEQIRDEKTIKRLLPEVKNKVGQLDLKAQGIEAPDRYIAPIGFMENTPVSFPMIYLNDIEQPMARWPNDGYSTIDKVYDQGAIRRNGDNSNRPFVIGYENKRIDRWVTAKDAVLEGFMLHDYAFERFNVAKVNPADKTITTRGSSTYGVERGKRWAMTNLLEEIDMPGEFYIDIDNMILYFYPPYSVSGAELEISVTTVEMIKMENVSGVEFSNIEFSKTRGNIAIIDNCRDISFTACNFKNLGRQGLIMNSVYDCVITGCNFSNVGGVCVYLNGGNRQTLEPANNKVINNIFYKMGTQTKTYAGAVDLYGVGNIIEHNIMHEAPHLAIRFMGNDHKIRYNEIYNVVKESMDSGAIYTGRNLTMYGTEISHNYIHDVVTKVAGGGLHIAAIYLDDQYSGTSVHHNIIRNSDLGILAGGGHDTDIYNNIIMDTEISLVFDNRGEGWATGSARPGGDNYNSLFQVPYNKPPYSEKYPKLAKALDFFPGTPHGNVVFDNLYYNSGKPNIAVSVLENAERFENNIDISEGVTFSDPENHDYTIKQGDPILEKLPGLSEIEIDKIGLYQDEYRKEVSHPSYDFKLISPKNGEADINNLNYLFKWDSPEGADRFKLTIAKDADMEEVFFEDYSRYNQLLVTNLPSGLKSFYWKVTAENYSRQLSGTGLSKGNPFLFSTPFYDKLEKEELNLNIDSANNFIKTITIGEEIGQADSESVEGLTEAIERGKLVSGKIEGSQAEIDNSVAEIKASIDYINQNIKKGYVSIDYMLDLSSEWESSGKMNLDDQRLTLEGGVMGYAKKPFSGYEVLCMEAKANFPAGWFGFGLRQTNTNATVYSTTASGYLFVIKPDLIELQRFRDSRGEFLTTAPNTAIKSGEIHDIKLAALDVPEGVNILLIVDGKTIIDVTDKKSPLKDEGHFVVYDMANGVTITGPKAMPEEPYIHEKIFVAPEMLDMTGIFSDEEGWYSKGGNITKIENGYSFSGMDMSYTPPLVKNAVISFDVKFSYGDKWQAISFKNQRPSETPWSAGADNYLLAVKKNSIELQRFKSGINEFMAIVDNNYIKEDVFCNIEIQCYEVSGGTQIIIKADGKEIINYVDPVGIENAGSLAFFNFNDKEMTVRYE